MKKDSKMTYNSVLCGVHKPHDLQGYKVGDKVKYYDLKSQLHTKKIKEFTNETGEWICLMSNNILLHPDRIEGYAT